MTTPSSRALMRLSTLGAALGAAALLSACVVEAPPRYVQRPAPVYQQPAPVYQQPAPVYQQPAPVYQQPAPTYPEPEPDYQDQQSYSQDDEPVVSVYVDPPIEQPEPIAVQWAPPPMLVEVPPPQPYYDAVWTGGYWAWEGRWFWSAGRWAPPPRPRYVWVQPYYEHRADIVVFVPGFWCAPERHFIPPAPGLHISVAVAAPGLRPGRAPMGPQGVFVPPPPGSRHGIIVPAPLGTPPAVVVSAPAVVNVGMRVRGNVDINSRNTTNNVTNITNVTVEAPAGSTANGQAFQNSVPARASLAAGLAAAGRPAAPHPTSQQAIPTYQSGRAPMQLPSAQPVRSERNDRFDRNNPQNGGPRGAQPQVVPAPQPQVQPQVQQPQVQQPRVQQPVSQQPQPQGQMQPPRPLQGQGRPEFDQPPRQPAPINGQAPNWQQQGQPQQPGQAGRPPGQGYGQAQPGGQPQGQVQQPQPQSGQPPQNPQNPQDPRRRGGYPQGQQGGQPQGQPGAQPAPQPAAQGQPPQQAQQPPQAKPKEAPPAKEERRKPEREKGDDRDKKNGERDR